MSESLPPQDQSAVTDASHFTAHGMRILLLVVVVLLTVLLIPVGLERTGEQGEEPPQSHAAPTGPVEVVPVGASYNQRRRLWERGQEVYGNYCVGCHGVKGDGKGPAAARLITKPRDFTSGIYKFRSTDSGSLPLEADLHRTITRGLAQVSMPAYPLMPEQDKLAVIEYIKSFYPKWEKEKANRKLVQVPLAPADLMTEDRIGRGRVVYLSMGCGNCHGKRGGGVGATQLEYEDAWGNPQRAFDFTRGQLKSGDDPEDIYRVFHTGLRSIMPSFGGQTLGYAAAEPVYQMAEQEKERGYQLMEPGEVEKLKPFLDQFPATPGDLGNMTEKQRQEQAVRNSWDLVAYIQSLRGKQSSR